MAGYEAQKDQVGVVKGQAMQPKKLVKIYAALSQQLAELTWAKPVTHVYNPLLYAHRGVTAYFNRYGCGPKEVILLGMNPGPFGMVQTGVPFGSVPMVRDWLGLCEVIDKPLIEHPKRPVEGFACRRTEVSGQRLWGWAQQTFGTPEAFTARFFVANYCPLAFMGPTGKNITPNTLPAAERAPLFLACDKALRQLVSVLQPKYVIGIGKFAQERALVALAGLGITVGHMLHPSPANPQANTGWDKHANQALHTYGL